MVTITLPHRYKPRPYQLAFLNAWDSGIKRFILVWHRRSGKDKTVFSHIPKKAFERVGVYFYFLPTYAQAKKVIWDGIDKDGFRFLDHIPPEIIKGKPNETEMKIELVNGAIIQLVGADKIDSIVGSNPVGVVFSEYSLMKPNVWDFIRPILAENGGWAVFVFTPRGMNHAWKLLQQGMQDTKNWFTQILTVADTKAIPEEILEQEKKEMPEDLFNQEYYCKFIEGAGQFFRNIDHARTITESQPIPTHRYKMGVDLAKYQDYTVITIIDLMTFNVLPQIRFNQIDYTLQKAKIEAVYHKYYKPLITIDSTGVGEPIFDDLSKAGLNIEAYKFTEKSRMDLLTNQQLLLEAGKIKLPDDDILFNELRSFQYTLTESGRIKVQVPEGIHDDTVMSLCLATWNLPNMPLPLPHSLRRLTRDNEPNKNTSFE